MQLRADLTTCRRAGTTTHSVDAPMDHSKIRSSASADKRTRLLWCVKASGFFLVMPHSRSRTRACHNCGSKFDPGTSARRYCKTQCRTQASYKRSLRKRGRIFRDCRSCGSSFELLPTMGRNTRYCSDDCAFNGQRQNVRKFHGRNPGVRKDYNRNRSAKYGTDTVLNRALRKYPELPRCCEASGCDESRVINIAHRPEHKRNGEWQSVGNSHPSMIWILCPTHHALLDKGICTISELGLDSADVKRARAVTQINGKQLSLFHVRRTHG